jgi:hydrogenase maturation protease
MSTVPERRVVVIGVGNPLRGDDGAGRAVVRRVHGRLPDGVAVLERDGEPAALMEAWEDASAAFLADAVLTGAAPGTVHRFEADRSPLPTRLHGAASTHGLGVAEAIELARALGRLPETVVLYGIESGAVDVGGTPAPAVDRAIATVARRIVEEVSRY